MEPNEAIRCENGNLGQKDITQFCLWCPNMWKYGEPVPVCQNPEHKDPAFAGRDDASDGK